MPAKASTIALDSLIPPKGTIVICGYLSFKAKKESQPIPSIPFFLITGERKAYEQPISIA